MRLLDLSRTLAAVAGDPLPPSIVYVRHEDGARQMGEIFGIEAGRLPDSSGWAGEEVTLATHSGTHMDAPWHYGPTAAGLPARTIDEIPMEWCYGRGVVLDFRDRDDGRAVSVEEVERALARAGHALAASDIVLIASGADRHWGTDEYARRGCGLSAEAVLWLVERGVRVIGTDAFSLDVPFETMRRQFAESGDPAAIWPAHFAGRRSEYCQLEKLTNLERLPPHGFTVACFPIKVARASAGWVRAVAFLPEGGDA